MQTVSLPRTRLAVGLTIHGDLTAGPPVIALHGFPDTSFSLHPLAAGLTAAGHPTVTPNLRGYAPTGVPVNGDVTLRTLAQDVIELMDALGLPRVSLIGHDWGSVIAFCAANLAPERIERLVLLSVPPPRLFLRNVPRAPGQLVRSRYMAQFQVPRWSEAMVRRDDFAFVETLWRRWSPGFEPPPERLAEVRAALTPPGALTTALSYYRGLRSPRNWWTAAPLAFARPVQPTIVLTGARDACIAPEMFRGLAQAFLGPFDFREIPGAGHFLPCEAPEALLAAIVPFLNAC